MVKSKFQRWKEGVNEITQLQMAKINVISMLFVLVGILIGLYATFVSKSWWMFVILLGSLGLSIVSYIGILQRYIMFASFESKPVQEVKNES
jgi:hypothetical protein